MNCKTKLLILLAIAVLLVGSFYLTSSSAEQSKGVPSLKATAQGTPQTSVSTNNTTPEKASLSKIAINPSAPPVKPAYNPPSVVQTNPNVVTGPMKEEEMEAIREVKVLPPPLRSGTKVNPGDDCTNPLVVTLPAQLPYSDLGQTTCGRGNDYSSTCLGSYDGGEDIIYQLDVTAAVVLDITINSYADGWVGLAVDDACPLDPSTCLYKMTNSSGGVHTLAGVSLAPGTYYIMIDTWPTPDCITTFDLTMTGAAPPPANDNCANATAIGDVTNLAWSTSAATYDGGGSCLTSPNLWYVYTATCTGTAHISLCGSSFDTKLAVYDGYSCSPLPTQLGCNDDACGKALQSELYVPVVGGNQYLIEVGGYSSYTGNGVLTTSCAGGGSAPPNDDCAGAPVINTFPTTVSGTTIGATIDCPGLLDWYSVWYEFDLPYACNNVTVDFCPTGAEIYQVGVVLYNSCPPVCANYILYSSVNWPTCGSGYVDPQVTWNNLPAGSYWFPVAVWDPSMNPFMDFGFTVSVTECSPAQPGENCATAIPVPGLPYETTGNSCGFLNDYDETCPYSGGTAPDVVYSYSPATNQAINISLCNSFYDTKLFVYEDACASGTAYACNDDACGSDGYRSQLFGVGLQAGHTYYIVVDGYGASCGDYDLIITEAGEAPENDNCDGAIAVAVPDCPNVVTVDGSTVGATIDCPGVLDWNAVWYSFELPYASNKLTIDYCPTATPIYQFGIVLYNSCPLDCYAYILASGYQFVTCPNSNTGPQAWWSGLPAGTYYLPVAVWDYSMNPFMDFTFTACVEPLLAPANDNCENAEAVGNVSNLAFSTEAATFDGPGSCQTAPNIWYCYTATCDGNAFVSLCGSSYDTKVAAYDGCTCPPTTMLACNDDACGGYLQSEIAFPVVMGQQYLIEVGGYSTYTGSGVMSITCALPPPNDECTGAPIINTFPQTVSGTTFGAAVDCPDVLAWNAVWYQFDVPYNCNKITVDYCGTQNNPPTVGVVIYNSCPPDCPSYIVASGYTWQSCSDGYTNLKEWFSDLPPGSYWFPVYLGSPMDFSFTVTVDSCVPCDVVCPPGAMIEGEPTCYDGYIDNYNGGCNSSPYIWQDITCNTWVCGTSGVYDANYNRDTDWYRVQVSDGTLTWKVVAEFPVLIFLIDAGSENCSDYTILSNTTAAACDTAVLSQYVPAGVYWLWVGPSDWGNYPCGVEYVGYVECTGLGPQISVTPTSFNQTLEPGQTTDATMQIHNVGSEALEYEIDYNLSNTWLGVSPRFGTIPPAGTDNINIHFDATSVGVGSYDDVLLVASNSVKQLNDTVQVPVHLEVAYPPDIDVASQLSVGVLPGCNIEKPLKVSNDGLGPLNFQAHVSGNPPLKVSISKRPYQENTSHSGPLLAGKAAADIDQGNPARLSLGNPATPGTPLATKGDTLFDQEPRPPDAVDWSFATSDAGAGYKVYENVWGITEDLTGIQWWGLALIYNAGWSNGTPEDLLFNITVYSDPINDPTMPPTELVCSYTNVAPTVVHTGLFFAGLYEEILFSWDLGTSCTLPSGSGWVAIQSQSSGMGDDWFLWASALTGDGYSYQEGSGDYLYDDALILVGGTGCPFTVAPTSGTVAAGGSTELVLTFDGSIFTQCNDETLSCYVVINSNDPDEPVVSTKVDFWSGRGDVFQPTCFIDIGDVVFLINYILKNGPAPSPLCMGDCDPSHDGVVDVADLVYLSQFLFQKGAPPQATPASHGLPIQR